MPIAGFEPAIPAIERPQTLRFRLRGHWDRQKKYFRVLFGEVDNCKGHTTESVVDRLIK